MGPIIHTKHTKHTHTHTHTRVQGHHTLDMNIYNLLEESFVYHPHDFFKELHLKLLQF